MSEFFSSLGDTIYQNLVFEDRYMIILKGLWNTLFISFFAILLGVTIGVVVSIIKVAKNKKGIVKILDFFCNLYINIIRGTPIMLQLMIMYFVIFGSIRNVNAVWVAILTFGINSGAYVAEIIRAGILAVDKGQTEAGRSLGLSSGKTMRLIVLPQAIKNILPALGNEFITLIKETSIAGAITVNELTRAGDIIRFNTLNAFVPLITVAIVYLIVVLGLTRLLKMFERRLARSDNR